MVLPCGNHFRPAVAAEFHGKAILFYARRPSAPAGTKAPKAKFEPKGKDVSALVDGSNALARTTATAAQVQRVAEELYPKGTAAIDQACGTRRSSG
jgi:hypothetical protein